MSTLLHFTPPFSPLKHPPPASASASAAPSSLLSPPRPALRPARRGVSSSSAGGPIRAHKVVIEHEGQATELEVEPDETILSKAIDSGLPVPHDCKLGVCMTCPARLVSGSVDQSEGMLSDDVVERGYALLCVSYPTSDCTIKTIPEEELLSLQLATAND